VQLLVSSGLLETHKTNTCVGHVNCMHRDSRSDGERKAISDRAQLIVKRILN